MPLHRDVAAFERRAARYEEGYPEWVAANLPVDRGNLTATA